MNDLTTQENFEAIEITINAELTSRCMQPHEVHLEEWEEFGTLNGVEVCITYKFDDEQVEDLDPDSYNWDFENVTSIKEVV